MKNNDLSIHLDSSLQEMKEHEDLEYPVGVYQLDLATFYMGYVRWHWHEEIEINFVKEGSVTFLVGDESIVLSAGEAIFINQNLLHSIHPIPEKSNKVISLVFHPSFLFGHGQTYLSSTYLLPILTAPDLKYFVLGNNLADGKSLLKCIRNIIYVNIKKIYGYELATKGYLCQLWMNLLNRVNTPAVREKIPNSLSQDEIRIKDAILYIENHYNEPISLEDIATSIHISKGECCRCFKRVLKLTPFQYLIKFRIFQSARIIRTEMTGSDSISELASLVGFNNTSYYNKLFKQYMHCTPSQYKSLVVTGQTATRYHQQ